MTTPELLLKKYWGYAAFRPVQADIIQSVLEGQDTLALLPTGGGKSICYQVPGLMKEGICIVVSPLIALMNDQVAGLKKRGIKAVAVHSALDTREIDNALNSCIYGGIKFLYCSPERLQTELFIARAKEMNVNLLAVDEAHCISQWGHDFRPSYLQIAEFRKLLEGVPVLALTATAKAVVQAEIQQELAFKAGVVFKSTFARPNLSFSVRVVEDKEVKLLEILHKVAGSAIVYVRSRKATRQLAELIRKQDITATYYHAGLSHTHKEQHQQAWLNNTARVMVATNAFGMGIDKPNVRLVVHFEAPSSIEDYYQEAGRAGRDGHVAFAVLLAHKSDAEKQRQQLETNHPSIDFLKRVYQAVANHFQMAVGSGFMASRSFVLHEFCQKYELDTIQTFHAFHRLNEAGLLQLTDSGLKHSRLKITVNHTELYKFQVANKKFDNFIKSLLRIYGGGLFTDYLVINETKIANFLKVEVKKVGELLVRLNKLGMLHYIHASGKPELVFLQPRQDAQKLFINDAHLARLKTNAQARLEAMLNYIHHTETCRMQQLLVYFDEGITFCGKCDVCLTKKHAGTEKLYVKLMQQLNQGSISEQVLFSAFAASQQQALVALLRQMMDAGVIIKVNEAYRLASN